MHFECFINGFLSLMNTSPLNAFIASFLYACLLGHSAMRQTELHPAIRLSHPVLLNYNKSGHYSGYVVMYILLRPASWPTNDSSLGQ